MFSTEISDMDAMTLPAPAELHYWPQKDISAGIETKSLCGEIAVPAKGSSKQGVGTSYTCPDCMLRYSLLPGGGDA